MMTGTLPNFTRVPMSYYTSDMVDWCNDNVLGHGRVHHSSMYFDLGYSWWAECCTTGKGITFHFAREADATAFLLRWS
jgi:hypothetical protein